MPNILQIRMGEASDVPAIAQLVNTAFRPERFFTDADRTNPEKVSALLQKGEFLLVCEDGKLVGCVYAELRGERGYLGLLSVDPQRRRCGLGARLIAAAEEHCRSGGCHFMDLTFVNVRKELPGHYRRFGYEESGTLPFPADQVATIPVHLVRMSKPL